MKYVVIEKRTHKKQHLKNVVKVTETVQTFRFTLEHGDVWEFNKSRYKYYSLKDMERPVISKEKLIDIFNKFFSMKDTDAYGYGYSDAYWFKRVFTDEIIDEFSDFIINELVKNEII